MNINDGSGSTLAHIVWLMDKFGHCCPIRSKANKICIVVCSTIAAEALGLQEGLEAGIYFRHMLKKILGLEDTDIDIQVFIDNRSVMEAVHKTCS